ncbi:MAG: ribosome silencing factor [Bacteroidales bacterium]|nr:ribosome silencing factor [Bacteroidales bacterium]
MKKKIEINKSDINVDKIEIQTIAEAMLEKKAKNVISMDLRKIGASISDYFVICNADSTTQVVAISDYIEEMMDTKCNRSVLRKQGKENGFWIILDFINIVVHVFKTEYREFYRLEDLWADAEKQLYEE